MATEVFKYRLYCETEQAYVEGWGESPPTACYSNNTHTIDLSSITQIDEVQYDDVNITGVNIDGQNKLQTGIEGFVDRSGYNVFRKGYQFIAASGDITEHTAAYNTTMMLQGLGFKCDENVSYGDYVEVELVDKDGTYYPAGTVLAKFAETIYVWANREFAVECEDAKTVPPNIYVKFRYVSVGTTDVKFILEHYMRTIPES